jgi:TRAP-type transport system small permease protein
MNAVEKIARYLSGWFNWIALAALTAMLALVTADIVGAKALGLPVPGGMDLTSLLGLLTIAFATAQTHLTGRHIKVEFVTMCLPKKIRKVVRLVSTTLCLLFFGVAFWRVILYAEGLGAHGEASLTVKIPLSPFAYAMAFAFLPMLLVLLLQWYAIVKGLDE